MRLIDADALDSRMYHEVFEKDSEDQKWDSGCWIRYKLFQRVLREQPTIEPEREKGEWVHGKELSRSYDGKVLYKITYEDWHCNKCGIAIERSEKPWYKFCPNCGADMRGEKNG